MTRFASSGGLGLAAIAAAAFATGAAEQTPRFTAGAEVVLVDVLVTRGARPVPDLTAADFTILDSGVEQNAALVGIDRLPVSLLLALDTSASVRGAALDHLKAAARAALGSLRAADEAALVTFAHQVALGAPWTTDRARLTQAIDAAAAQGSTALSDAAFAALGLRPNGRSRTLVLLFTDGDDTSSWLTPADVVQAARRSDSVVYAVTLPGPAGAIAASDDLDASLLGDPRLYRAALVPLLARETGGEILRATDAKDLAAVFVDAVSRFNTRYVLSYTPTGVPASGWHPIEVKVSASGVDIRARRGYAR